MFGKESVQVLDPDSVHRNPAMLTDDNTNIHNKLNPVNRRDWECNFLPSPWDSMAPMHHSEVGSGPQESRHCALPRRAFGSDSSSDRNAGSQEPDSTSEQA